MRNMTKDGSKLWKLSWALIAMASMSFTLLSSHAADASSIRCSGSYTMKAWKEACWRIGFYKDCKKVPQYKTISESHGLTRIGNGRPSCGRCYAALEGKIATNGWSIAAQHWKRCN